MGEGKLPVVELEEKVHDFFLKNDRFPKFVFVGLTVYEQVIKTLTNERRFISYMELATVLGPRKGIQFLGDIVILPTAHLKTEQVGEPEGLFV